jgi:hypothetical protein
MSSAQARGSPQATGTKGRPRRSKRALRWWAYLGSALSFAVPWAALTAAPRSHATTEPVQRQVIEVRKITRRIIVQERPEAPSAPVIAGAPQVRYVYTGGGSSGGGGGAVHTRCSTC